MKFDPVDICANAIAITPIRFLFAWLAGSMGSFLPVVFSDGKDAFEILAWQTFMFPFYLVVVAFMSGWWGVIAVPLILVVAYKLCRFMINDNTGSDLMVIFLLTYLIAIRGGLHSSMFLTSICGVVIFVATYYLVRRDRELYPE
jgi:hypothetical protein